MRDPASALVPPRPPAELAGLAALVLDSLPSPHSRRAYGQALTDFLGWYAAGPRGPFRRTVVHQYRAVLEQKGLAPSSINVRLAAVRKLAAEAAANGLLAPELAAGIAAVKGLAVRGVRIGNWLTRAQVRELLNAPDWSTVKSLRDRAILGLLAGCGLRRSEIASLTVDRLAQREGRWVLVDLSGKGRRVRSVPVPAWVKALIDRWMEAGAVAQGPLFRPVNKRGVVGGGAITAKVIWWVVREYASRIGVPNLAPHDLRRTCAKLCRSAGGDLEQIQFLLGHASVQTTERYLGSRQNLAHAVNDHLGIEIESPPLRGGR